jgi:hypothetical protein
MNNLQTITEFRPLSTLAGLIKKDLDDGNQASRAAGIPYYRAAGEKLLEAKAQLSQGEFLKWVDRNFHVGKRQAQEYMLLASTTISINKRAAAPPTSLSDFQRSIGRNRPSTGRVSRDYQQPIDDIIAKVNLKQLSRDNDELERAEERRAQNRLALQLIDIGYKALASKLHPDKGGSRAAMARLNAVRDQLKNCAARI